MALTAVIDQIDAANCPAMASKKRNPIVFFCFFVLFIGLSDSQTDTIQQGQEFKHGMQLFSASGIFKLGFFQLGPLNSSFLGIWYNRDSENKPLWIANRNNPIRDNSGVLIIDQIGNLKISCNGGESSIVLYSAKEASNNTIAVLLDSGNFVLRSLTKKELHLWQSFDYPTDTLLPGMNLGFDSETGINRTLTSWRGDDFPASGSFTLSVDPTGIAQMIIWWRESLYWASGAWQVGGCFSASLDELCDFYRYNFSYTSNDKEMYFNYSVSKAVTIFPRLTLTADGELMGFGMDHMFTAVSCKMGGCKVSSSLRSGCAEQKLPACRRSNDKFVSKAGVMSRHGFRFGGSENMSMVDCWAKCFRNCSCVAYASAYENGTIGCEIWTKGSSFTENNLATLRPIHILESGVRKWWIWLTILVGGTAVIPLLCSYLYVVWKKCKAKGNLQRMKQNMLLQELGKVGKRQKDGKTSNELQMFSFGSISTATNGFSAANKLGEGGFGPVYKGRLVDGQEVAIKRLSRNSGQGLIEFKNEALLIAKLQHTNLVRLFGFCIEDEEKILIYEYMLNKSLDYFLFDDHRKNLLNWNRRFGIIEGVAQGLVYPHKYSRLKVIHRDLKASNILLDNKMSPKIADFGMARIFALNEAEENTSRVVRTYGYMSPEYAMKDVVSVKTDVFSFGVILLEVVSGKKNNSRFHSEDPLNLIGYAWQLWNEGRGFELVDASLDDYPRSEVLNCIHIGLLCVQDHAPDRPTMPDVVSMLSSNDATLLPPPKQLAFFIYKVAEVAKKASENCSMNDVTMSVMEAR